MVYIGTIHPHHLSTGELFMKAKKNVLIEKPLAMNSREVQELITAAKDSSVFLMEVTKSSQNHIYHSPFIRSNHSKSPFRQFGHVSFPYPLK